MTAPPSKPTRSTRTKRQAAHTSTTETPTTKPAVIPKGDSEPTRGEEHHWPIVEIDWIDAIADGLHEWLDYTQIAAMQPEPSKTVGYLITTTDTHTTITSLINTHSAGHAICIPNSIITNITTLKP